ncbi:MAG: hypothetical protein H7068_09990 [Pedobacter sp.]|nr:hypothetical protein [Chitinophagaceae bacterium]
MNIIIESSITIGTSLLHYFLKIQHLPPIMKSVLSAFLLVFITVIGNAQQQAPSNQMKLFFEKAYLHIDREYYVPGDDVWFKAYLLNAQTNYPIYTSNNLYVELIAPDASLTSKEVIRLENGIGNGDFKLPDSLTAGTYRIRAYTNWMRNFGDNFIFERTIKIGSKTIAATNKKQFGKTTANSNPRLQFFPEGGSLISGVASVVAFKAEDIYGKGIVVQGDIIDSKGKSVAAFKSNNLGMGSCNFVPVADEVYDVKATIISSKKSISSDIPIPLSKGIIIAVTDIDTSFLQVAVKTNKATLSSLQNSLLIIEAKHTGKRYFDDSIRLTAEQITIKIPKANLPQGIIAITLLDEKRRPNSERLFYNEKSNPLKFSMATNKKSYMAQENTIVNINTLDIEGHPLKANLSMAVVDASIVPISTTNIVNYLLLQSELKGDIDQPDTYFDKNNNDRLKQLDLLLLTQGWRDFVWLRLAQQGISVKYIPEGGITISGKVKKEFGDKGLPNMNVTLFATQAKGNKLFSAQTDSAGKYYFDGLNMTGTQRIKVVSRDNKGKKGGFVTVDELFNNQLPTKALPITEQAPDTSLSFKQFITSASQRVLEFEKVKQLEIGELPGVTVTSTKAKTSILGGRPLMDAGYKDSVFSPDALDMKRYETLENYLVHKINGAQIDVEKGGIFFGNKNKSRPRFVIDNREDIFERLDYYALPVNVISKIVIQHLLTADDSINDVYVVNLTLKPEANQQASPDLVSKEIDGYYQARSFYVPQPKASLANKSFLTTLFWQPYIETENGNAKVVIANKSTSPKWSIIVEGITENGLPISNSINYEVK